MSYSSKNPRFSSTILTDQAATSVTSPKSGSYKIVNRNGSLFQVDSSGNEVPVGSGAGEPNLIASPSTAQGWVASASGVTVATSTTSTDLPLVGIFPTCLKITPVSSTDYARYRFTMSNALLGKKLKVEWFQRPLSGYATGDFKVDVYYNAASDYSGAYTRVALSTDSSAVSSIPNLAGKYTTTFDADSSNLYYELRIVRTAGTTALNLANVVVGPGVQPQGAVIGEWLSYTPTYSAGWGTVTNNQAWWRRVGSNMELTLFVTTGTVAASVATITLPTGYTINTSALHSSGGATESTVVGGGSQDTLGYVSIIANNNTSANVLGIGGGSVQNTFGNGSTILNSSKNCSFWARVPISEWAGSGTIVVQNDVEYVSNSSTSDAADTTSFAYGPAGSAVPGTLTAARKKRVSFPTPISDSSQLILEIQPGGSGAWIPVTFQDAADNISPYLVQNSVTYGIGLVPVSATTVDVQFGQYAANSSATFGGVGTAWGSVTANTRYRVRKAVSGQAVGFGIVSPSNSAGLVSASGLPGKTDGVAVAAGYVGERITGTMSNSSNLTSGVAANVGSLSLTAGVWLISGVCYWETLSSTLTPSGYQVGINSTSATLPTHNSYSRDTKADGDQCLVAPTVYVNISSTTTYYLVGALTFSGGSARLTGSLSTMFAVRIA